MLDYFDVTFRKNENRVINFQWTTGDSARN